MYRRIGRAATITVLAAALAANPAAATANRADQAAGYRHLLQQAANDLAGFGISGVQALIRDGRRTTEARAGVADVTTGRPVPENGYFRMGSNTKTFVSVILLQLAGEGRLRLDDTVDRWLPGVVSGNGNDGTKITIRQVLRHQSGLAEYTDGLPAFESAEAFERHRYDHWEDADLVARAVAKAPEFAPGTDWGYSNTNYIVAGMIIERVTHRPWYAHLRQRIFAPAGMTQTSYPGDNPDLPNPHVQAYEIFGPDTALQDTTRWNTTVAGAAGGLVTTPTDLSRFWQALQQGRLLRPAEFREMHRTVPTGDDPAGRQYGLGIFFTPSECGGFWGHDGSVPGMTTVDGVTADGTRTLILSISSPPDFVTDPEAPRKAGERAARLLTEALC
ncbi:serine hydrolase domain-containing protein [Catenuloplanes sp. NPDC051500]|uniref:serine hydrolase domain-containing protein n=1 Tax=Catenuloplanes sp. NPDC051500 TaxID=3363959 RepID=UPI0037B0113D